MSAVPSVRVGFELDTEVVADSEDGLVEFGAVTQETRGSLLGSNMDSTGTDYRLNG